MSLKTPYTSNKQRLSDVIAAIQVMGTYKFYKLGYREWADRISGNGDNGAHWKKVFEEHPEFFRLNSKRNKASLVWRRNYQKLYHVDKDVEISRKEFDLLPQEKKGRISRNVLTNEIITTLVSVAINLHSSELDHKKDSRWWIALVFGLAGIIIGSLIDSFA